MHAREITPFGPLVKNLLIALCLVLILSFGCSSVAQAPSTGARDSTQRVYVQESWGFGIVVPDGSALSGGGNVDWGSVTNVTAVIQIPDITNVSAPTYAVMSLMTQDGAVLQTAFGIYPDNVSWLVYSMFIENINQIPQHYTWVINSSAPAAEPGDMVTISIYQSPQRAWSFKAANLNTSLSIQRVFGANSSKPPKLGDQEVFALESYASDSQTFQNMGNMTLHSLFVDGRRVTSGWYPFSDWDMLHNPLFVVGGAAPPFFMGISALNNGKAIWYYAGTWNGSGEAGEIGPLLVAMVILTGAALTGVLLAFRFIRRPASAKNNPPK